MGVIAMFTLIKGRSSRVIAALLIFLVIFIASSQDSQNLAEESIFSGDNFSFSSYTIPNQIYVGNEFWFVAALSYRADALELDKQSLNNDINLKPFDSIAAYSQEKKKDGMVTYYRKYLLQAVEVFPGESYKIGPSNITFVSRYTAEKVTVNVPQYTARVEKRAAAEAADLAPPKGEIFNWRWFARIYTAVFALVLMISPLIVLVERKLRFRNIGRRAVLKSNPLQVRYWEVGKILRDTRAALFEIESLAYDIADADGLAPVSLWEKYFPVEQHLEWESLWVLVSKAYAKDTPEEKDAALAYQLLGVILERHIERGEEKNARAVI